VVRVIRFIFRGIVFVLPWLFRAAWSAILLMATTLAAIWSGIPGSVEAIASEWLEDATLAGFPTQYDRWLFVAAETVALIVIFMGWVLLSYLTVFIIWWVF